MPLGARARSLRGCCLQEVLSKITRHTSLGVRGSKSYIKSMPSVANTTRVPRGRSCKRGHEQGGRLSSRRNWLGHCFSLKCRQPGKIWDRQSEQPPRSSSGIPGWQCQPYLLSLPRGLASPPWCPARAKIWVRVPKVRELRVLSAHGMASSPPLPCHLHSKGMASLRRLLE